MEVESVSLLPKEMSNGEILKTLDDKKMHYVTWGAAPNIARIELMRLIRHNGELINLWDIDRSCERLFHVNNIIKVGGEVRGIR